MNLRKDHYRIDALSARERVPPVHRGRRQHARTARGCRRREGVGLGSPREATGVRQRGDPRRDRGGPSQRPFPWKNALFAREWVRIRETGAVAPTH